MIAFLIGFVAGLSTGMALSVAVRLKAARRRALPSPHRPPPAHLPGSRHGRLPHTG